MFCVAHMFQQNEKMNSVASTAVHSCALIAMLTDMYENYAS